MSKSVTDNTACDREPIHLSGAIQPFGCLFAVNLSNHTVEFASKNVSDFLKIEFEKVLGAPEKSLQDVLSSVPGGHIHEFVSNYHKVIEYEPPCEVVPGSADLLLHEIDSITRASSPVNLFQKMAEATQHLTQFERVKIYKFGADWSGTVIAETIVGEMPSFLDLRFPASDIPEQARRLYSQNLLRYIPDVHKKPVSLESLYPLSILDLSDSDLRSVSPVHLEYLRNMAVGASMSLSVIVDGKLWGLIACHHTSALDVSPERRNHCKILCQLFSRLLAMQQQAQAEKQRADAKITQIALIDELSRSDDLIAALSTNANLLLDLVHANGAGLVVGKDYFTFGDAPVVEEAHAIICSLDFKHSSLRATDHLEMPAVEIEFKGALAAKLSGREDVWLVWVRPEVISEVAWAGEPVKLTDADGSEQLHPRRSFEIWKETVSGYCAPWTEEELSSATALSQFLRLKIERDRAELERHRLTVAVKDSNQKLAQFVDTISHDLRSPLISIGNLAQWVEKDLGSSLSGTPKLNLDLLQKRVSKMRAQLNELLDYSKAGNFRAVASVVDVGEMINGLVESHKTLHSFDWRIDELPTFSTVKAPLEHVFSNLIDNAVKYSGRPDSVIEIGYEDAGDCYRFFVSDQGKGIPVEYLDEIFLPLRTLSGADSDSHGMGLAFVKRIVEQAGGEVTVQSAPDAGACFKFTWKKVWDGKEQHG